jgi:para-nitrobenzyl esterase
MKKLTASLLVAFGAVSTAGLADAERPLVAIETGKVLGTVENGINSFKGIPYATPPVGEFRWRPPQPPVAWDGVFDASKFGPACPQPSVEGWNGTYASGGKEDCLHLNVYTPEKRDEKLPVMVWIHGGALISGSSQDPTYTPVNLVKNGVIIVTLDYRLGKLGYFAPQQLIDEAKAKGELVGNYGTMDQIEVLKWVKRNIAAFGGDPDNVTIFGESGGGRSVTWLMVSQAARGLFHKAIAESGRVNPLPGMIEQLHGKPSEVELDSKYVASLGATSLESLRALPYEKLVLTPAEYADGDFLGAFIDGQVIPGDPVPLFAKAQQAKVPFMIGTNSWDSGFFSLSQQPDLATYAKAIGSDEAKLARLYKGIADCLVVTDAEGDAWYMGGVKMLAGSMRGIAPGYAYYFDFVTEKLRGAYPGTLHAWEIPYVFGSLAAAQQPSAIDNAGLNTCEMVDKAAAQMKVGTMPNAFAPTADKTNPEDIALSEKVAKAWASFAKTGNPNAEGMEWPVYDPKTDVVMDFSIDSKPVKDLHKDRVNLQIQMMRKLFSVE